MLNKQRLVSACAVTLALLSGSAQAHPEQRQLDRLHSWQMNNGYIPFEGVIEGEGPGGVGMEINQDRAGHFIVQRLEPHGPAESSKISIGDRILRINDGLHIIEVVELMRGDVGTKVRLQIQSATRKRTVALKGRKMAPSNQLRPLLNKELPGTSHK